MHGKEEVFCRLGEGGGGLHTARCTLGCLVQILVQEFDPQQPRDGGRREVGGGKGEKKEEGGGGRKGREGAREGARERGIAA